MNYSTFLYRLCLLTLLSLQSENVISQVYKWQDEHGKWHFSDTKPAHSTNSVEQQEIGPVNRTVNHNKALRDVFPESTPGEEKHRKVTEAQERQRAKEIRLWCLKARKRLKIMEGPVVFLDRNGQQVPTTEAERDAKARKLRAKIDSLCP
jgi:hypothetical protein